MVELEHAVLTVAAPDDVALYKGLWSAAERFALFDDDLRAFLNDLSDKVRALER